MELITKCNDNIVRTEEEKLQMIEEAADYYGKFLTALGFDWKADPHSENTPKRVAKSLGQGPYCWIYQSSTRSDCIS